MTNIGDINKIDDLFGVMDIAITISETKCLLISYKSKYSILTLEYWNKTKLITYG